MEKESTPFFAIRLGRGHRGFSLIELTMVVAIVAVLSAIAVPKFSNATTRYKLDAAARRLAGDIVAAQSEAIATSSSRTLTFNFTQKNYTISSLAEDGSTVVHLTVELDQSPYDITSVAASIASSTTTPIKFDGFGKPNGSGTVQLKIRNDRKTLTIDAATGHVKVN